MKSKIKNVLDAKKAFQKLKDDYDQKVFEIIQQIFDEHLKEKCIKHNMSFFSGNSTFIFKDNSSGKTYDLEEFPKCLRLSKNTKELLNMYMENYGFSCDSIGTMMEPFVEHK